MSNDPGTALAVIEGAVLECREAFLARRVEHSMNFEAEAGFAMQLIARNDYTIAAAMNSKQAVIDAITNVSAIGLSLNPASKLAYLVPREGKIILDFSYMGLLHLAVKTGSVMWAQAAVVRENDHFKINGFDCAPTHEFNPFNVAARGEIIGAYCVVKTHSGDYLTTPMALTELHNVRDRSDAWSKAKPGKSKGPWESFPEEMMKKTVIKRAYKLWPKSDRLAEAVEMLNRQGEGIDFEAEDRAPKAPGVTADPALLEAARDAARQGRTYFAGWFKDVANGGQTTRAQRETLKPYMGEFAKLSAEGDTPPAEVVEDATILSETTRAPGGDDWASAYEREENAHGAGQAS
jgi:recombination protein RecT